MSGVSRRTLDPDWAYPGGLRIRLVRLKSDRLVLHLWPPDRLNHTSGRWAETRMVSTRQLKSFGCREVAWAKFPGLAGRLLMGQDASNRALSGGDHIPNLKDGFSLGRIAAGSWEILWGHSSFRS
jgi:hypothetical protein